MRVRCIAQQPNPAQIALLGNRYRVGKTEYGVIVGDEYLVLGLGIITGVCWLEIATAPSTIVSVPSFLFEVINGRASKYWDARFWKDGHVTLWPASFYHQHYHDDLSEGVEEAVVDFRHLLALFGKEDATDDQRRSP